MQGGWCTSPPIATCSVKDRRIRNHGRYSGRIIQDRPIKKIRSQTVSRLQKRHTEVGLQAICGLFGYSRQAHYKQLESNVKRQTKEEVLLGMVKSYRKQMPRIGGTKLHYLINQTSYSVGKKELYDLLRNNKLLIRRRKKFLFSHIVKQKSSFFKYSKPISDLFNQKTSARLPETASTHVGNRPTADVSVTNVS